MKRLISMLIIGIALFSFTACGSALPEDYWDYNVQYGLDASQYSAFLSKEITAIVNQCTTTSVVALSVKNDGYPIDDALAQTRASLENVKSARDTLAFMRPAQQYQNNYENVLRITDNILDYYDELIRVYESGSSNVTSIIEKLNTESTALTAEANVYYK